MNNITTTNKHVNDAVTEIRQLHSEIGEALRTSLDKALRIGELLTEQKRSVPHGQWLPWVRDNLPFKQRTARNYMRLYEQRDRIISANVADLGTAYKLLVDRRQDCQQEGRDAAAEIKGILDRARDDTAEIAGMLRTAREALAPDRYAEWLGSEFGWTVERAEQLISAGEVDRPHDDAESMRLFVDTVGDDIEQAAGAPMWFKMLRDDACTLVPEPPVGCGLTHNEDGDSDIIIIEPSMNEGYYYITHLQEQADGSQIVNTIRRPVAFHDRNVGAYLRGFGLLGRQQEGRLRWRAYQCDPQQTNRWLDPATMTPTEKVGAPCMAGGWKN